MADHELQALASFAKQPVQSIIERVARLLCRQRGGDPDVVVQAGDGTGRLIERTAWELHLEDARAILAVMHEPTDQMVDAGFDTELDDDGDMAPRVVWSAMIDAALEETLG